MHIRMNSRIYYWHKLGENLLIMLDFIIYINKILIDKLYIYIYVCV